MEDLARWFERHDVHLPMLLVTIGLLILAAVVILVLNRLLRGLIRRLELRYHLPYETVLTASRIANGALWILAALLILNIWGVSIGGLWAVLVSAATVIGVGFLAVWTLISNITASFFITIWRPFRLGQFVEMLPENLKGRVVDRNLMFTVLREEHGSVLQIPNNLFFQKMFRVAGEEEQYLFEFLERSSVAAAQPAAGKERRRASAETA